MYRVTFYSGGCYTVTHKDFKTFHDATKFSVTLPIDAVLEIKHYEDSVDNRPTLWCEK